jgi:alkylmercury lyase
LQFYQCLSMGKPVTIGTVATACGVGRDDVRESLGRVPASSIQFDDRGRVVGIGGLTLEPTRHRLTVDDRTLYTWCAFDTLFAPEILGRPVAVDSNCPTSDTPIRLTVTSDGVEHPDPEDAVLSFVTPDADACCADIRGSFCRHVNFFASRQAALDWPEAVGDMLVLTIDEGFRLGRVRNQSAFGEILFS